MTDIDEAFLAERERIRAAATDGTWSYDDGVRGGTAPDDPPYQEHAACIWSNELGLVAELDECQDQDGRAIADAHNHQPALIAEIRRLTIELAACEDVLNGEIKAYAKENERLRALLTKCAEQFGLVNQDPTMFDLLQEFEA